MNVLNIILIILRNSNHFIFNCYNFNAMVSIIVIFFFSKINLYTLYFKINAKISSAKYFATKIDNAKNLLMYEKSAK